MHSSFHTQPFTGTIWKVWLKLNRANSTRCFCFFLFLFFVVVVAVVVVVFCLFCFFATTEKKLCYRKILLNIWISSDWATINKSARLTFLHLVYIVSLFPEVYLFQLDFHDVPRLWFLDNAELRANRNLRSQLSLLVCLFCWTGTTYGHLPRA